MQCEIRRSIISGEAQAPPSAPLAHRALALSLLAPGQTQISGLPSSPDIAATVSACRSFGADIVQSGSTIDVFGPGEIAVPREAHFSDSNTALKLMLPLCASFGSEVAVSGSPRLSSKPLSPFLAFLESAGAQAAYGGSLPATVRGPLSLQEAVYPAMLGSQFLSGIMLCAPLLAQDAAIGIEGGVPGWQYVKETIALMKECGIQFYSGSPEFLSLPGGQEYLPPSEIKVPASPYLASFLLLAGALSGKAEVRGSCDWQAHIGIFQEFGAGVSIRRHEVSISASALSGTEIEASEAGLFLPHALVLACAAPGATRISGLRSLAQRQAARMRRLCRELGRMGAKIAREGDALSIEGGKLSGAKIEPEGDAAVAMACAAAAVCAQGASTISGAECVERAYPGFFRDLVSLGAIVR